MHRYVSSVEFDHAPGDSQPNSEAPVRPGGAGGTLRKQVEYTLLRSGLYPNAIVLNLDEH
jgi:hypothetical protein